MHSKTRRPSAGTLIGTVALVFAMTGAAVALPGKNTVDSGDIKNNTVKSADIKNKGIKTADLNPKAVAPKVAAQSAANGNSSNIGAGQTIVALSKAVPAGRYAISAKVNAFLNGDESMSCGLTIGATQVDRARLNPPNAEAAQTVPMSMLGVATVPAGTPIEVDCSFGPGNGGSVDDRQLVAIPVG